jgi:hypothetical protein
MSISKLITSASLAFAMIGGAIAFSPAQVEAGGKKQFISNEALKKNNPKGKQRPGAKANPWSRGCSLATRCKRV